MRWCTILSSRSINEMVHHLIISIHQWGGAPSYHLHPSMRWCTILSSPSVNEMVHHLIISIHQWDGAPSHNLHPSMRWCTILSSPSINEMVHHLIIFIHQWDGAPSYHLHPSMSLTLTLTLILTHKSPKIFFCLALLAHIDLGRNWHGGCTVNLSSLRGGCFFWGGGAKIEGPVEISKFHVVFPFFSIGRL